MNTKSCIKSYVSLASMDFDYFPLFKNKIPHTLLDYSTENYIEDENECVLNNYVYVCRERSG